MDVRSITVTKENGIYVVNYYTGLPTNLRKASRYMRWHPDEPKKVNFVDGYVEETKDYYIFNRNEPLQRVFIHKNKDIYELIEDAGFGDGFMNYTWHNIDS